MQADTPNIVFITTDTQGREMLSCYVDRPGVETPHLDRLAARGMRFGNAYTSAPVCTPARATWYTGLPPNRSGAWANDVSVGRSVPMLAELVKERGYEAWHVGKWHLDAAGYDGAGVADGGFAADAWYDLSNFYDEVGEDGFNRFGGWNKGLDDETFTFAHRVADRAIDLLKNADDNNPFFLSVSFDEPHGPYICPPPFRGRFAQDEIYRPSSFMQDLSDKPRIQQAYQAFLAQSRESPEAFPGYYHRYYDCNSFVDYEIGRVLDAIDQYSPGNTVVIFTSDHGDHLGAFGLGAKGPTMYDHTVAVPLLIAGPGIPAGGRNQSPVGAVDVWATIFDYCGFSPEDRDRFPAHKGYDGRSLRGVLEGDVQRVRDAVFIEYNRFGEKHHQVNGLFPIRCIRTDKWKLSINLLDTDELYDMQNDPQERVNRVNDLTVANIRNQLHDAILSWQEQTRDLFRGPLWVQRAWREDLDVAFQGLHTTGLAEEWAFGRLTD